MSCNSSIREYVKDFENYLLPLPQRMKVEKN